MRSTQPAPKFSGAWSQNKTRGLLVLEVLPVTTCSDYETNYKIIDQEIVFRPMKRSIREIKNHNLDQLMYGYAVYSLRLCLMSDLHQSTYVWVDWSEI
jgi:hypothetical protein